VEVMQRLLIKCKSLNIIKLLNADTATTFKWDKLEKRTYKCNERVMAM
jgi:hypothetical protein